MNKQDKEEHKKKMDKLISMGFFKDHSRWQMDWDSETETYEKKNNVFNWTRGEQYYGWSDLINKRNWLYMEYKTATPVDVRNQCFVCSQHYDTQGYMYDYDSNGIARNQRPDFVQHVDKIFELRRRNPTIKEGDLIVRNGYGANFMSYHVSCARYIMECVMDNVYGGLKRSLEVDRIVEEQNSGRVDYGGNDESKQAFHESWRRRYDW